MDLTLQILQSCSGKTLTSLNETFGDAAVSSAIAQGYIAVLPDNTISKTEKGMQLSKPLGNPMNEKIGQDGYNLITDSDINIEGQLLLS